MKYGDYRDARQFQGSKKAARRKEKAEKEVALKMKQAVRSEMDRAIQENDIETAAALMGVRLR